MALRTLSICGSVIIVAHQLRENRQTRPGVPGCSQAVVRCCWLRFSVQTKLQVFHVITGGADCPHQVRSE